MAGVLVFVALATAGCFQNHEPPRQFVPGDPLYEQFTSSGDRIIIEDRGGQPALKLRQRRTLTRVYDANMIPVGRVRVVDDEIEQRAFDTPVARTPHWIDEDTAELSESWRLERVGEQGWDLFDADGFLISLWRLDEAGQWTIRSTYGDAPAHRVRADETQWQVVDPTGSPHLSAPVDDWSELKLLALSIDDFEPLQRYTLAAWADLHLASPGE